MNVDFSETLKTMVGNDKEHLSWREIDVKKSSKVPPQPDATRMAALAKHWHEMFDGIEQFEDPAPKSIPPLFLRPLNYMLRNLPAGTSPVPSPRNEGDNWSGAVQRARFGQRFAEVVGRLHIPKLDRVDNAPGERPPRCSAWIGLDGALMSSCAMPQLGVLFGPPGSGDAKEGGDACVWFQWWIRNKWTPPLWLTGLEVGLGNTVLCQLCVTLPERTQVVVYARNESTNKVIALEANAPAGLRVDGRTAQWIVERPGDMAATDLRRQLFELPSFKSITIDGCAARAVDACNGASEEVSLRGATRLRMTQRIDDPRRTLVVAIACTKREHSGQLLVKRRPRRVTLPGMRPAN
jgi:hypothetical protein